MSTATSSLERLQANPRAARAHAIKNCLSAITMTCTLIDRRRSPPPSRLWTSLRSASRRLGDLLLELLADEIGISVATSSAAHEWCRVEEMTALVSEHLWARAESAGVSLTISCGGGELRCHQESLTEALLNLTANAIEASPPGGTVSVQTQETADRDQVWVVKDSGSGFPDYQRVEQGSQPKSTKAGGWGFGVGLAHIAIAHQGGVMKVTTASGVGTTITIWLPRETRSSLETRDSCTGP
jgi:two-component system sensor histidine kinase HydH